MSVGDFRITDPFHQGEHYAAFATLRSAHRGYRAFEIHGALDYVPAWLAIQFHGAERYFLLTELLYSLASIVAALLLYVIVAQVTRPPLRHRPLILLLTAAAAGQFVGPRDLFLLAALLIFLLWRRESSPLARILHEVGLGIVVALGMFWSFDRGIAGMVSLGTGYLLFALSDRKVWVGFAAFAATLLILNVAAEAFSIREYVDNVRFLLGTASQWSHGLARDPMTLTLLAAVPNVWALAELVRAVPRPLRWNALAAPPFVLGLLALFFFRIGSNRADSGHIVMTLWVPALICLSAADLRENHTAGSLRQYLAFVPIIALVVLGNLALLPVLYFVAAAGSLYVLRPDRRALATVLACILAVSVLLRVGANSRAVAINARLGAYAWLLQTGNPPPNETLAPSSARWVAGEIVAARADCLFDLTNNGIINGLTLLPACSGFAYAIYATRDFEQEMIESVRRRSPPVLVFSSTDPGFTVDGKTMHQKFPALTRFLVAQYPDERCGEGYCLRYR